MYKCTTHQSSLCRITVITVYTGANNGVYNWYGVQTMTCTQETILVSTMV